MTTVLKELELDEVSLVDVPANQQATVELIKRDNGMTEKVEELEKAHKAAIEKAETEVQRLIKALTDNGFVVTETAIEKKAPDEAIEVDGVSINKSAVPEVIWKKLEADRIALEKAAIEKRVKEELPNFRGTDEEKAALLKAVDASPLASTLLTLLKSADAVFKGLTQENGHNAADGDMKTAADELNDMAKAYADTHKVSLVVASAAVQKTAEGRALLKKIYEDKE